MITENLINVLALLLSLAGITILSIVSAKLGGKIGLMIKLVAAGIFFSVSMHSLTELLSVLGYVGEKTLLLLMGSLLSIGSTLFVIGGVIAIKSLK